MRTFQIIKTQGEHERCVFEHGSPSETASIAKKLTRHALRNRTHASYEICPPVCPDCECPILEYGNGYCCQCEPEISCY